MTGSCVIKITRPYYHPSAPDGTNVRAIKREPRTNSAILFEHQGVIIGINTFYKSKAHGYPTNQLHADISFEIPEGNTVQLVQHHIAVSAPRVDSWKSKVSGRVWTKPGRTEEFPRDATMVGRNKAWRWGTAQGYGNTKHATFFFSALLFEGFELKNLEIKIPTFLINNQEVELPIITLKLNSEDLWTSVP
jgi:hypothetical protein